jgi:hypothetical protein
MAGCTYSSELYPFGINVLLHIVILLTILSLFFILIASPLSKSALEHEINKVINETLNGNIKKLPPEIKNKIAEVTKKPFYQNLIKLYETPDRAVRIHNEWLFKVMLYANIFMLLIPVIIIAVLTLGCSKCIPINKIVLVNLITFACVGIIEYLFFTNVAIKFVPTPPSTLVKSFYKNIKTNFQPNFNIK